MAAVSDAEAITIASAVFTSPFVPGVGS